ncbi:MAG: PQQ-binding-like beta-propeller repeat protein [Alphaproteobacteria bacterium]
MKKLYRIAALAGLVLALGACETFDSVFSNEKDKKGIGSTPGKREAVMAISHQLKTDAGTSGDWIKLPEVVSNRDWLQPGGASGNMPGHPALGAKIEKAWRSDIGKGSGGALRIVARPIVAGDHVYAMDARGRVSAFDTREGERIWRSDTAPEDSDADAVGGGIAYADDTIFAATGHGEVVALSAKDGQVAWRRSLNHPLRAAPTVSDGRVFVVTIANEAVALDAHNGTVLWRHNGINEPATLMGSPSPAVLGDSVIVAYGSGEIFALRVQNGRMAWSDLLTAPAAAGSLPAMSAIHGFPVAERGGVFVSGQNGETVALVLRTGERAWDVDVGGINTPAVAGNAVFLIGGNHKLLAMRRDNGKVIWTRDLPDLTDPEDHNSSPIIWTGPVLAGGRLFAVSSHGKLDEFSPVDGKDLAEHDLPDPSMIPPVVAGGTLYVVTDGGDLVAFR